jgi:hypothetical protein
LASLEERRRATLARRREIDKARIEAHTSIITCALASWLLLAVLINRADSPILCVKGKAYRRV